MGKQIPKNAPTGFSPFQIALVVVAVHTAVLVTGAIIWLENRYAKQDDLINFVRINELNEYVKTDDNRLKHVSRFGKIDRLAPSELQRWKQAPSDGLVIAMVRVENKKSDGHRNLKIHGLVRKNASSDAEYRAWAEAGAERLNGSLTYKISRATITFPVRSGEEWQVRFEDNKGLFDGFLEGYWIPISEVGPEN